MHGIIASIMTNLGLTYKEVFEEIPYRNLILMQRDKLHEVTGDIIKRAKSSSEIAGRNIK